VGDASPLRFDGRLYVSEVGVVAGFVLEVEELLGFFDIHLIILCCQRLQI